ncbi:MAG: hypothetical protein ACTHK2_09065 [Dokdonella sp.]|uniref:hypothetical protein n=1 Tax=Dokdonella sp. TaxID=2291710 RepID=UPI003F7D66B6
MNAALLNVQIGDLVLVTTSNWFYGPDGRQYRAVHGTLRAILTAEQALGVKPRQPSTNWYAQIGEVLIAGCQIHYAIRAPRVHLGDVEDWNVDAGAYHRGVRPSVILNADEVRP